jgi:hypothetical protein
MDGRGWEFSRADTVTFGWALAEDTFDDFAAGFRALGMLLIKRD